MVTTLKDYKNQLFLSFIFWSSCIDTLFGDGKELDFGDFDLIFKVISESYDFKFWPKVCFCVLSHEKINGFQPFFIYCIIVA